MSALPNLVPQVRAMLAADLDAVAACEKSAYAYPWTRGNFQDALNAGYACRAMMIGADLVAHAVVMLAVDEAHLLNLTVAPQWQGRGLGKAMLQHMIGEARAKRAQIMLLEVRPSNDTALKLYATFGFEQLGLRKGYYPSAGGNEDALLLGLPL